MGQTGVRVGGSRLFALSDSPLDWGAWDDSGNVGWPFPTMCA